MPRLTIEQAWLRRAVHLLALLLLGVGLQAATAQDARLGFARFKHTRWTAEDGAPQGIGQLAQTPDGFLWMSSSAGLFRFDGLGFERVAPPSGGAAEHASPSTLLVGRGGELWVGWSQRGGVSVLRGGRLRDTGMPKPPPQIVKLAQTADGAVWATWGGAGKRLWRYTRGRWQVMDDIVGLPEGAIILSLLTGPDGALWLSLEDESTTPHKIAFLRRGEVRLHVLSVAIVWPKLAFDRAGALWMAGRNRTELLFDERGRPPGTPVRYPATPDLRLAELAFDRNGGLWGTTRSNGIFHIADARHGDGPVSGAVRRFTVADGLTAHVAYGTLVDREGDIWFGTELGLDRFRPVGVTREPAIPADAVAGLQIAAASNGTVYVSSRGSIYEVPVGGVPQRRLTGLGLSPTLCPASAGGVWALLESRVVRLDGGSREAFSLPTHADTANNCAEDRNGRLWLSWEEGGLSWHDERGWHDAGGLLRDVSVWDMGVDPGGDLAFSIGMRDLGRIRGNRVTKTRLVGLGLGEISTLARGRRDLFLGGPGGLVRVRGDRLQRLSPKRIPWLTRLRGLVQTAAGETWLVSAEGISRVSTAALDHAFDQPEATLVRTLFDVRDGLTSSIQHFGFRGAQAVGGGDGRMWFLNRAGVAMIDPARIETNRLPPPVVIRSLASNGRVYDMPSTLTLPAGTRSLSIAYTALSLAVPDRVQFRYRLDGVDEGWVDPGARREATYANLGPGDYRFRVIATNNDGVWNRTGATLAFTIRPTFVQSWPFKLLCAFGVLALLWLGYRLRLRALAARIRSAMAERVGERERIARELHDTLLQSVQALSLRFQLVAEDLPCDADAKSTLEEALDQADAVIAEGRDRVRDLRPVAGNDDIEAVLGDLIRRQAFLPSTRTAITTDGERRSLDPMVLDEVTRIASEALFNIWRHAQATRVNLTLRYGTGHFVLRFADNGIGLDPAVAVEGHRAGHFGLPGMRERAARLSGELAVRTPPGGGTEVTLSIPAGIAYGLRRSRS